MILIVFSFYQLKRFGLSDEKWITTILIDVYCVIDNRKKEEEVTFEEVANYCEWSKKADRTKHKEKCLRTRERNLTEKDKTLAEKDKITTARGRTLTGKENQSGPNDSSIPPKTIEDQTVNDVVQSSR